MFQCRKDNNTKEFKAFFKDMNMTIIESLNEEMKEIKEIKSLTNLNLNQLVTNKNHFENQKNSFIAYINESINQYKSNMIFGQKTR